MLVSNAAFTRMTDLLSMLLVRCNDGYRVYHFEVAFMFLNLSLYSSCRRSRSQSLCTGELIKSKCALSDLFKFCCQIFSLMGVGSISCDIKWVVGCCPMYHYPTYGAVLAPSHWTQYQLTQQLHWWVAYGVCVVAHAGNAVSFDDIPSSGVPMGAQKAQTLGAQLVTKVWVVGLPASTARSLGSTACSFQSACHSFCHTYR